MTNNNNGSRTIAGLARPRGSFPHVKVAGDLIFVSGTSSRRPDNTFVGVQVDELGTTNLDIRAQTRAVIDNLERILHEVGAELSDALQITAFLTSMNEFGGFNEAYSERFGVDGPTRTTVAVHQLPHPHLLVEMQLIARRPQSLPPEGDQR